MLHMFSTFLVTVIYLSSFFLSVSKIILQYSVKVRTSLSSVLGSSFLGKFQNTRNGNK